MGDQLVPTHVDFSTALDVAEAVGPSLSALFRTADDRYRERFAAWPMLESLLRTHAKWWQSLSGDDYVRAIAVFEWLRANPASGLYARQLPIPGVDTKWLEQHSGHMATLLADYLGRAKGPLTEVAGLKTDSPKKRIRLLDETLRKSFGGLSDLTVRMDELAASDLGARIVLVVENLQTALACEDFPGAVVIVGGGFAAYDLAQIPWIAKLPVVYWGDIDYAGFQILAALRNRLPHARSCLMDEATLLTYRSLWSVDPHPPRHMQFDGLSPEERSVAHGLSNCRWGIGVRLEQERIPWTDAWQQVKATLSDAVDPPPTTG